MRTAVAFLLLIPSLSARNAQLSGLILDSAGTPIPGAQVTAHNEWRTGGKRSATSNSTGVYTLPALVPGVAYKVRVSAPGFDDTRTPTPITLEVSQNARLDFTLNRINTGSHSPLTPRIDTITVTDHSQYIDSEDASVGTLIPGAATAKLPLNGRGIQTLITLSPGVLPVPVNGNTHGQFANRGQRPNTANILYDGIPIMFWAGGAQTISGSIPAYSIFGTFKNLIANDEILELRIQTASAPPEFGRMPGAQISIATRSGKQRVLGSIYEYLRNDALDAGDWFSNQLGTGKPSLRYHNFGGTIGGPLQRRVGRSFFFASLEQLYYLKPQPSLEAAVPSITARKHAPSSVRPFLTAYPLPTRPKPQYERGPGFAGLQTAAYSAPSRLHTYAVRLDHTFGDQLMAFARLTHSVTKRIKGRRETNPANYDADQNLTDMFIGGMTHILSPRFVNDIRFSAAQQQSMLTRELDSSGGAVPLNSMGLFSVDYSARVNLLCYGFGSIQKHLMKSLTSSDVCIGKSDFRKSRQFYASDNFSMVAGKHHIKIGADYRSLSPVFGAPGMSVNVAFAGIYGPAGLYSGKPYTVTLREDDVHAFRTPAFSSFVQDIWKMSQHLTITWGTRWEVNPSPRITNGSTIATATGFAGYDDFSRIVPSRTKGPFYPTRFGNFAPRLGVVWRIANHAGRSTVFRAGVGRYYDLGQDGFRGMDVQAGQQAHQTPVPSVLGVVGERKQSYSSSDPISLVAAPNYHLPKTYQFTAMIQQSVTQNQLLSVAYIGAAGRSLLGQGEVPLQRLPNDFRRQHRLIIVDNIGTSNYNGLEVQLSQRFTDRFHSLMSYTWSHSLDDVPNTVGSIDADPKYWSKPLAEFLEPRINRGSSDFDIRHALSGSILWNCPGTLRYGRLASILSRDWSFSAILFARSAPPTDIVDGSLYSVTVQDPDFGSTQTTFFADDRRPDLVPNTPLYLYSSTYPGSKRINPEAFAALKCDAIADPIDWQPGIFALWGDRTCASRLHGTLGRNVLRLFGSWQADIAVHREIPITERIKVKLIGEAFNVFNHPNFSVPSQGLTDPAFGIATKTLANGLGSTADGGLDPLFQIGSPRAIQLALRVSF